MRLETGRMCSFRSRVTRVVQGRGVWHEDRGSREERPKGQVWCYWFVDVGRWFPGETENSGLRMGPEGTEEV